MNDMSFAYAKFAGARPVEPDAPLAAGIGQRIPGGRGPVRRSRVLIRFGFAVLAALTDSGAIFASSSLATLSYNYVVHRTLEFGTANLYLGLFAAALFVVLNAARHAYSIAAYLDLSGHAQRAFAQWNVAFLAAATFGFLTKAIEDTSRGGFLLLYFTGIIALFVARASLVLLAKRQAHNGGVLASRIVVVGFPDFVERFMSQRQPEREGVTVVAKFYLSEQSAHLESDLAAITAEVRRTMPDDILIAIPWSRTVIIDRCVASLMGVPSSLHLYMDPDSAISRLAGTSMNVNGAFSNLSLRGHSMRTAGLVAKRLFDIVFAAAALVFLAPVMLAIALAIKLEGGGPVLFFQTRLGFNKTPFRIAKFRTMTAMEDGADVRQAITDDERITRAGRFLRRTNLDELPQLFNVLRGEMSLVGPRPHALAHDVAFEGELALYARRHNVKPGITGWAQVHGYRGRTDTAEKIANRLRCDLYYVDNWSLVLDIWIITLTIFSRRAYANAG